jgi:hypoxanthine phosphoribosyltransferase
VTDPAEAQAWIAVMTDECPPQQPRGPGALPGAKKLKVLVAREELSREVQRLAHEITRDYVGKHPLIIGVLKGSFVFLADLIRLLDFPVEIDLVRLSSYGAATVSSGKVKMVHGLETSVRNRHVVIVDDIVDTGLSLSHFATYVQQQQPDSLRICTLLDKPSRRQVPIHVDYVGLAIPDKFVVGYGIDCNEEYRNLCDICVVEE